MKFSGRLIVIILMKNITKMIHSPLHTYPLHTIYHEFNFGNGIYI